MKKFIFDLQRFEYIVNYASGVTINGGAGNDLISLRATGGLIQYASGDGNDTGALMNRIR